MTVKSVMQKIFGDEMFKKNKYDKTDSISTEPLKVYKRKRTPEMVNGTVRVLQGELVVTDPQNDGAYPTIIVPETSLIQVLVDGKQVIGEIVVSESHTIKMKLVNVNPSISYETTVSEDEFHVWIQAKLVKGVKPFLKDTGPSRRLRFVMEEIHTDPDPAPPGLILSLLSKNGYSGTIDYDAVQRLCNPVDNQKEIVLSGVMPQKGLPPKVRASAALELEQVQSTQINRFSTVAIGTVVAVIEPEIKGVPGSNVYGVPVPAQINHTYTLPYLGYGVISVNGNVVAIRNGRPTYTRHVLDVVPERVFNRDIFVEDGEIQFDGNIIVHGSIKDQSVVKASGTVVVYGSVHQAHVFANMGVLVQEGIYGSEIVSGRQQISYDKLFELLQKIIPQLQRFKEEYLLMVSYAIKRFDAHITIPKIPSLLFENRHEVLSQMLVMLVEDYSKELSEFNIAYREVKKLVESTWRETNRDKISQRDIETLLKKIKALSEEIKGLPKDSPLIRASTVASSSLQSIGNIIVTGSCYSSTLESKKTVSVHKGLRGGFVVAEKSVYVGELGNPSGTETSVRVTNPAGFVRVKLNHINTLIEVNGRRRRAYDTERDIRVGGY